jgi:ER membrane protein complex subunit 2
MKAAVEELHKAVSVFYGDFQLWLEMAEIYLSLCDYPAAAFCFEELILLQPNNHAFHTRLADTYYTLGK